MEHRAIITDYEIGCFSIYIIITKFNMLDYISEQQKIIERMQRAKTTSGMNFHIILS